MVGPASQAAFTGIRREGGGARASWPGHSGWSLVMKSEATCPFLGSHNPTSKAPWHSRPSTHASWGPWGASLARMHGLWWHLCPSARPPHPALPSMCSAEPSAPDHLALHLLGSSPPPAPGLPFSVSLVDPPLGVLLTKGFPPFLMFWGNAVHTVEFNECWLI